MTNNSKVTSTERRAIQPTPGEAITSIVTNNTYTIGEIIGEGNFAYVYECRDIWQNMLAAKVLKPIGTYENVKESAEAEFIKLIKLRHPCITYVYDAFEFRSTFYIITERCHNSIESLFNLRDFNGLLWLMPIARRLLQGLYYLHLNNYVHQDIHEGNILTAFVKDEVVPSIAEVMQFKICDLGVAKLFEDINLSNTRAQWLLPPEVLNPKEFGSSDKRIDIYQVGLLFLQLAHSQKIKFSREERLQGKPREMALSLNFPFNVALEKALRRHVEYRTHDAMELWKDLNTSQNNK